MKTIDMIKVMEHFANGGEVERAEKGYANWEVVTEPLQNWTNFDFRIKEFQYPMWFKSKTNGLVIKFVGLQSGTVVEEGKTSYKKGENKDFWLPHTDNEHWEEIEEPKSKQTITMYKWLMIRGEEYYILNTSKIDNYSLSTPVKLLETYEIEI